MYFSMITCMLSGNEIKNWRPQDIRNLLIGFGGVNI